MPPFSSQIFEENSVFFGCQFRNAAYENLPLKAVAYISLFVNMALRKLVIDSFADVPPIVGVNLTVEIDESLFAKRKNHCGRLFEQQWVFAGIEEPRTKVTQLHFFQNCDFWKLLFLGIGLICT